MAALPQSPSAFPVDVRASLGPQPVMVNGRARLLYELHLTNFSPKPIELIGLDVLGADSVRPLATFRGEELEKMLLAVGPADSEGKTRDIGEGRTLVIFLDLALDRGATVPTALHHRLSLSIAGKDGRIVEQTLRGPSVAVVRGPVPVLRPPLRGSGWVAFNGFASSDHRRTLLPVDGKVRIAQRFAIDWMRLGPDGRLYHDDPGSNGNYYGYGAEVLAVQDGRVSGLKDGLPENIGSNERSSRTVTLDNVAGNCLILDLGHGRFAVYAHLQPGSLRVQVGDRVRAGDVLGLLGNSGNSDAPHLHFHVVDANSVMGAEGTPYEFETFDQLGLAEGPESLDTGQAWKPKAGEAPVAHRRELPNDNAVVAFPSTSGR